MTLGDRGLAVRLALDANLPAAARPRSPTAATGEADLAAVADAFADRGRPFEAGRTAERARRLAARRGALPARGRAARRGARAASAPGELREAGLLYERLIAQGSADEAAAARLALGRLLGRLGRHEEAARHLQVAARMPALRTAAWRALVRAAAGARLPRRRRARSRPGCARDRRALPRSPDEVGALEEAEAAAADGDDAPPADASAERGDGGCRRFESRLLGGGATGRVYEAVDTLLGRAGRAEAAAARRRAAAIPSARPTCASRARPRRPGACATRTSSRCTTRSRRPGCSCSS